MSYSSALADSIKKSVVCHEDLLNNSDHAINVSFLACFKKHFES